MSLVGAGQLEGVGQDPSLIQLFAQFLQQQSSRDNHVTDMAVT